MPESVKVIVLGTGQMGSAIARLLLQKSGISLVGVFGRRAHRAGMDAGDAIGLKRSLYMPVSVDLDRLLDETQPDVAIQATCSAISDAVTEINTLVQHNVNVISIAEEMAYAKESSKPLAEQMHWQAVNQGVSVLGTGVNPGFMMDYLAIVLTGVCAEVQQISITRSNDLSPYGPTVLKSQGIGLTKEAFQAGLTDGTITGHVGFKQSIHMIANTVGWDIDEIQEQRKPIVSTLIRETEFVKVSPGQVAGCDHSAKAFVNGKVVITLNHPQQIHPHLENVQTGDSIEIIGKPTVRLSGNPEVPGGQATASLAVNSIPRVLTAKPGLHCMADMAPPAAMLADVRRFLPEQLIEVRHGQDY